MSDSFIISMHLWYRPLINQRESANHMMDIMTERNGFPLGSEQRGADQFSNPPMMQEDRVDSFDSEGNMTNILWRSSKSSSVSVIMNDLLQKMVLE